MKLLITMIIFFCAGRLAHYWNTISVAFALGVMACVIIDFLINLMD